MDPIPETTALRALIEWTNEDRLFAANAILAFLRLGVCPAGYEREDLRDFSHRLLRQRAEALAAARGHQRDQALRNRIAGVASSWGSRDVLDPKEVQRVLTFLLSIELCVCGHERAEHTFGEAGTRAASLSRVGNGDWHHFEAEAADRASDTSGKVIRVPRPQFVLGDPKEKGSSLRILYGPEDENGRRHVVGYLDQSANEFDVILEALAAARGRSSPHQWQPIETAPHSQHVLARFPSGLVAIAYLAEPCPPMVQTWRWAVGPGTGRQLDGWPTQWTALPPDPSQETSEGKP